MGVDKLQYFNHKSPGAIREMFLHIGSVLKNFIVQEVKKSGVFGLLIDEVTDIALCTDGASVMTGKNSGVAARLKDLNRHLVSIHCICHKLSLACYDTNEGLAYVQEVERWLLHVWKFFDNSPKRLAAYLKIQMSVKQLQEPSKEAKNK